MFKRIFLLLAVILLLCSPSFADSTDEATLGGQDSNGYDRWRVPGTGSDAGDLIPGASGTDLGTSSYPIDELHATTIYLGTSKYSQQGSNTSVEYAAGSRTISLSYGLISLTTGAYNVITVPDGSYNGQTIHIMVETDGGWAIVEPTTCTGFTGINLDAALDNVTLTWISSTYGWIITGQYGVTLE